jgi:hypothetical protein
MGINHRRHSGMRRPNSGLPEFDIMIVQVGNSRLGCAGPESITTVPAFGAEHEYGGYGFRARAKTRAPE